MRHSIELLVFQESGISVGGENLSPSAFAECLRRWPEFAPPPGKNGLRVHMPAPSPLAYEVSSFFEGHGKKLCWVAYGGPKRDGTVIEMTGRRELDPAELESAPILWGYPNPMLARREDVTPEGFITIHGPSLTQRPIGRAGNGFCCTDRMRKLMEAEKFIGLTFRPVQLTGKCKSDEPIWQVYSDIVLPPVVTGTVNAEGQPHDPALGDSCCINDIFVWPVLLYPENLFSMVPKFDVACTVERFYHDLYWRRQPSLVYSQRFYQFCKRMKLDMEWSWAQIGGEYPNPYPEKNLVYAPGHLPLQ